MVAVAANLSGIGSLKLLKAKAKRIRATWRGNVRGVFRGNGPRTTWKPVWLEGVGGLRDASKSRGSGISSTIKQFSNEFACKEAKQTCNRGIVMVMTTCLSGRDGEFSGLYPWANGDE